VGWAIVVGHTKRQFQTVNLLEVDSKSEFFKNKHFISCFKMSLWILRYQKRNKSFYFFQCLLEPLCLFKNKFESLCLSNFIQM
jgi:hypothetical protein